MTSSGYKFTMVVSQRLIEPVGAALDDYFVAIAAFEIVPEGEWRIEAYALDEIAPATIAAALADIAGAVKFTLEALPATDWLAENRRAFPAQRFGRFVVYGTHLKPPKGRDGKILIQLDAATAFGSGEHATTRGCLTAMADLTRAVKPSRVLDLGCGSGILAIAAAKLWRTDIVAADTDLEAVRMSRFNIRLNQVTNWVKVGRSYGYRSHLVRSKQPYDLIIANILARPLIELAPELRRHLAPRGHAILSGLLVRQENAVIAAHRGQNLALIRRYRSGEWSALVFQK